MKKLIIILLVIITVPLPGCSKPDIGVANVSGFSHEISVRIPYDPMEDSSARLYVNNEGRAVFIKPNENRLGKVNAEKEYCPEIIRVDKNGLRETRQLGILKAWYESREGKYFIGVGGKYSVDFIDKATMKTTEVMDNSLVSILREYDADCFDIKAVFYTVPLTSNPGIVRFVGIYDIETGNEVIVSLEEDYVSIDGIDFNDETILVKAVKNRDEPPDLYILGLDGAVQLKLTLDWSLIPTYCNACFTQGGIVIYNGRKTISSSLGKYSCNGILEWSKIIPVTGTPVLKRIQNGNDELILLTVRSGETDRYIGCFSTDNGSQLYVNTFHDDRAVFPLDIPACYYLHPQWSLYPEIPPPSGRTSYFNQSEEIAYIEITEGIYYFSASPNGDYCAVVTDNCLSIFSYIGEGTH
ncbi:MAG: hypothetical protein JW762_16600 [Dehalococcoidales bacterium]|nr:hypothetical protein [Dehalococcoidales bacterium]